MNVVNTTVARLMFILALGFSQPGHSADQSDNKLQLGSVAMDIPTAMVGHMAPLAKYLSARTGYQVTFRPSPNLGSAVDELGQGVTQIAYLTPVAYINASDKFKAVPLVSPTSKGESSFKLQVVVRKDNPVKTMADLRGKTFAFGDKKALLQPAVVLEGGIRMEDLASSAYLNHYDNIAKAVLNGDFDAGILKDSVADEFMSKGLRVIYSSAPLPSYIFAVNANLPPEQAERLKKAMLALKRDTPENIAVLDALDPDYDGFVPALDQSYDAVRKLIKPFKKP